MTHSAHTTVAPGARSIPSLARRTARLALVLTAAGFLAIPSSGLAASSDSGGFLYGKVTTRSTTYEGRLRWSEEAFWGDHLNATKEERPFIDELPRSRREDREPIKVFGVTIGLHPGHFSGRSFIARFGDVRKIESGHHHQAVLTMKSGTEIEVDGSGSNDFSGKITVWDASIGEVQVDWDRIETIEFMPVPAGLQVAPYRLHGTVESDAGSFTGFIQWDKDECLSTDKLDGDMEDGEVSIDMGRIRSIERRSRSSSRVTLRDGRELVLDGSNDVDDDNRGIFVEDPRYGRVLVTWDAFDRVDFSEPGPSGPSYDEFEAGKPLRGTVVDLDGKEHSGRLVYDIDESETWELLNGEWRDVEYNIPFALIRSIVVKGHDSIQVTLKGQEDVVLEDSADAGDGNSGVLVLAEGSDPVYIDWDDVDRIDFE